MDVPFALRRRPTAGPADALLLEAGGVPGLAAACARLTAAGGPMPDVFAVAGGFLIAAPGPLPGAVRLRRAARALYVPADADLVPALHPDEADALTRDRGLVVLPGGRALAFDPARPVPPAALAAAPLTRDAGWRPFPERPPLAEHLVAVYYEPPLLGPDELLDAGGPGEPAGPPRPPEGGVAGRAAGAASLAAGTGLGWLGRLFGSKALSDAGKAMVERAMTLSPRLSESVLGRQAAALQELLRQLRTGDREAALRRALPIGGEPARGSTPYTSDALPTHSLTWSLGGLFGGGGRAAIWHGGGDDLQRELAAEYRRAAEDALRRGDHRRAAFVYGRLLADYLSAANALSAGGLHRDAAVLFRDKLGDEPRAAREFEAAGDFDTALALYRKQHDHERAGDLYRKLGDEAAALEQYQAAAERLAASRGDYLAAGALIWQKTERADLAGAYYTAGWRRRGDTAAAAANAVPCAVRLARILAFADTPAPLFELVGEVEDYLADDRHGGLAGMFFTAVADLAELPHLAGARDELRDRSRLALAAKLRQYADRELRPGSAVQDYFGRPDLWPPELVRDAAFALVGRQKRPDREAVKPKPAAKVVKLHDGQLVTACYAPSGQVVFAGFDDGRLVAFELQTGCIHHTLNAGEVEALATDDTGETVVALTGGEDGPHLSCFSQNGTRFREHALHALGGDGWTLSPRLFGKGRDATAVAHRARGEVMTFRGYNLVSTHHLPPEELIADRDVWTVWFDRSHGRGLLVQMANGMAFVRDPVIDPGVANNISWEPAVPAGAEWPTPFVSWADTHASAVSLAGVGKWRQVHLSVVHVGDAIRQPAQTWASVGPDYRAACVVRDGVVAAAAAGVGLVRLHAASGGKLVSVGDAVPLPDDAGAAACFSNAARSEVVVLLDDGRAVRVPFRP